jgi:proton-translocating NADH-quinone oxidoreductase chain L
MFDGLSYPPLIAIPLCPLAGAILTAFLGPRYLKKHSYLFCIAGVVGACVLSLWLLAAVGGDPNHGKSEFVYTWVTTGSLAAPGQATISFQLQADSLTAIMLTAITFVGSWIAVYSIGYMHDDPGCPRFFAVFALFVFSMTGLVLADNFVVLYAFWEGVGLCSYLLIGFWFEKPSAAAAARKAFLVTRLGDVGLLLGILSLWYFSAGHTDFNSIFGWVNGYVPTVPSIDPTILTTICLLLLCGAVGKSAQFPLHVWLPDAMEGPTPVSALIHAATMVTAGVYLIARCTPLFVHAPDAQATVAVIGGITALLAALIALTQNDLKRVLAYSTISQLGYMFMALGSATVAHDGEIDLVGFAVIAAIFHLFTHAFFKALLFLSAGSVMHSMGGVIDMRRFSGLRKVLPTTHWTFLCGALALAAFPLFSGFWSKDEILSAVLAASGEGHSHRTLYLVVFASGVLTAGLTSFYTFRAYFLTFWGEVKIPHEAGHHAHESPKVMTIPLMVLAVGAVGLGFLNAEPFTSVFSDYLGHARYLSGGHEINVSKALVMSVSIAIGLAGIGLAYFMYQVQTALPAQLAKRFPALYQLSLNKFHFDELYYFFIVRPILVLAEVSRVGDLYLLDKLVDIVGSTPVGIGRLFRPIQNGLVQFYALAMALGVTGFLLALMWRYAW